MQRPAISICHTTARPGKWMASYRAWKGQAADWASVEYVLCMDPRWGFTPQDAQHAQGMGIRVTSNHGRKCMVDGFNKACAESSGSLLILNSDDQRPIPNWDARLRSLLSGRDPDTEDFVIHLNTGWYDGPRASSIQVMSRARYARLGYAMWPEYESLYADDDFLESAYSEGKVIDGRGLGVFDHQHGDTMADPVYLHQNRPASATLGAAIISRRRLDNYGQSLRGKVILFCPVRQDPDTLTLALESHRALNDVGARWYFDDNQDPASRALLQPEARLDLELSEREDQGVNSPSATHHWTGELMSRMAEVRDGAIREFLGTDAEALVIVDSDLILHPNTVSHLMAQTEDGPEIVSEVFWSKWQAPDPWLPNVWDFHNYGFESPDSILQLREPGLYPVGGLGALTIIRRSALERGARYRPVPGVRDWPGEDRHFCIRASSLGLRLWADTHYPPYHVYRPQLQLPEARQFLARGCPQDWFRREWLDSAWVQQIETLIKPQTPTPQRVLSLLLPGERFSSAWVSSLLGLTAQLQAQGWRLDTHMAYSSNVYVTRTVLWESVRSQPFTPDYILWLDDDNLLDLGQFQLLLSDLETHPQASGVAGWAWVQPDVYEMAPIASCGQRDPTGQPRPFPAQAMGGLDGLVEVDYTGFPAFLMRGSVLGAMPLSPSPFLPILDPAHAYGLHGEDESFCAHGRASGLRWFVDGRVQLPHLKLRPAGPRALPMAPLERPTEILVTEASASTTLVTKAEGGMGGQTIPEEAAV